MSDYARLQEFFMQSYSLEHTKRYSMKPVIHAESVAAHSFFVALGVLLMSKTYRFDVNKAVKIAICHDLAEMEISDVNHMVKKQYPAVAAALKEAEMEIIRNFPEEVQPFCTMYHDTTPEALIVHLADAMQCLQYAENEIGMGNGGYMIDVRDNSTKRIFALQEKLKPYRMKA